MGHCIRAIIGEHKITARIAEDWLTKEIELPQGFGMILCTIRLLEDIEEVMEPSDAPELSELDYFDASVNELLENYSFRAKLAYIETDYFGGYGTQAGVLYENGKIAGDPKCGDGTINALLKELGVWRTPDTDEFDMLGLGKYRRME
ncbi:MAG: hypothetical protein K2J77_11795 [Oscillospiraceae bacterium]|nr:hypothetical protein [Oscillospiraceae bacterium]